MTRWGWPSLNFIVLFKMLNNFDLFSNGEELPSWVQAKITKAADYIRAAANHEEYEEYEGDE